MLWQLFEAHLYAVSVAFMTLIGAVIVMQERRSPQSTLAWLLAMVVAPWLAVPLFLALGTRKIVRRQKRPIQVPHHLASSRRATFEALGGFAAQEGNSFRLIDNPHSAYTELMALVDAAKVSIDAQFYIVSDDTEGRAFLAALTDKARRGVRVRLMMDRIGSFTPPKLELERLKIAGGQFHWFAPFINRWDRGGLNLRNHRKLLLIDGVQLLSGGMNVGADYMRQPEANGLDPVRPPFDDLAFVLEGPGVGDYAELFRSDWKYSGAPDAEVLPLPALRQAGPARVQLVPAGPDRPLDALHLGLAHAMHRANSRIWIATPYFLPTEALTGALSTAARRGLDVRLLMPAHSNHRIADFARGAYVRGLQNEGCKVFLYPRMLHAKAGMIDEMAWAGTANFDIRSLQINFETALMIYDAHSMQQLEDWFEARFAESKQGMKPANLTRRLGEGLFRLSAPLL